MLQLLLLSFISVYAFCSESILKIHCEAPGRVELSNYEFSQQKQLIESRRHCIDVCYKKINLATHPNTYYTSTTLFLEKASPQLVHLVLGDNRAIQYGDALHVYKRHKKIVIENATTNNILLQLPIASALIKMGNKDIGYQPQQSITFVNQNIPLITLASTLKKKGLALSDIPLSLNQQEKTNVEKMSKIFSTVTTTIRKSEQQTIMLPSSHDNTLVNDAYIIIAVTYALQKVKLRLKNNPLINYGDTLKIQLSDDEKYIKIVNQNNNLILELNTKKSIVEIA